MLVTAIFDIGKSNKKFFLFDEDLREVHSDYVHIAEKADEDGFPCDDLDAIRSWMMGRLDSVLNHADHQLTAVNFSTYGATLVHLDESGDVVTPLYNYLKPFPEDLKEQFFREYGPAEEWSRRTASPTMGMLNSGLQLYWLKHRRPEAFRRIHRSLHFPEYLASLFTGEHQSAYPSIGCHTGMWDHDAGRYHEWIAREGLSALLPSAVSATSHRLVSLGGRAVRVGTGIHDSSAALIPYVRMSGDVPFMLMSTGTWSIVLNPFNSEVLTTQELDLDCLTYLQAGGQPVKAARLFLGNEYKIWARRLATFFGQPYEKHRDMQFNFTCYQRVQEMSGPVYKWESIQAPGRDFSQIPQTDLSRFTSYEIAYHGLMHELTELQVQAIRLAGGSSSVGRIYLDGGFVGNPVFIEMIRCKAPAYELIVADMPLGSALGAAEVMTH